jgi:predicted dehydrogenase
VVGAGAFGRNHLRVIRQSPHAHLAGVFDIAPEPAEKAAADFSCLRFLSLEELTKEATSAVIASPTGSHAEIGCRLMEAGLDVLVEKPIAADAGAARKLIETAERRGRILQVGHLERFNPAILALQSAITLPLFFEIHRLSEFSPRSLDVDVVLDLMIHDIDIVLSMLGRAPEEIRAAGIHILSQKVDIANVRLQFSGGATANLTASRVSTERVRKLRLFQPGEYISIDYSRQDLVRFQVKAPGGNSERPSIGFAPLAVKKDEPLRLELEDFFECVAQRRPPRVTGSQALAALEVACSIVDKIEEHRLTVEQALKSHGSGQC